MASDVATERVALVLFSILLFSGKSDCIEEQDDAVFQARNQAAMKFGSAKPRRYLLYDVNYGEGFNLRRDVYMRIANLVKVLVSEEEPWTLVLPPWSHLYHWKNRDIEQSRIPWATFFDLESLRRHVPVIEFEEYLKIMGKPVIEEVYYLQNYAEGWTDGKWEERMDRRPCVEESYRHPYHRFEKDDEGKWHGFFFGYGDDVYAEKFECLSVQAHAAFLKPFLLENTTARSVMLNRAEELIHGEFSEWSKEFWTARRSMRFAKHLRDVGDAFRRDNLDSSDEKDKTVLEEDWRTMKRSEGDALGGPYLAVHMRRRDYLYGHKKEVPSIKGTAQQLKEMLIKLKLKTLFVATDAPVEEYEALKKELKDYKVVKYEATREILEKYKDGGVAIIDQWIAAHARAFIGTCVSTFTFRINEEREILGFHRDTTYNRLCGEEEENCEKPTRWEVKYN